MYASNNTGTTVSFGASSAYKITVSDTLDDTRAKALVGEHIQLKDASDSSLETLKVKGVHVSTKAIFLEAAPTNTPASGDFLFPSGGGAEGISVFSTLVLGAHAYAITELEGGGLTHIVKQLGYGDDPLNQRSSVGWKATRCAKRLVEQYMVRIESSSSYSPNAAAN